MGNPCQIELIVSNAGGAVLIKLQADARTVNVISNAGLESNGDWSLNTAGKCGVRGFTALLKLGLSGLGI